MADLPLENPDEFAAREKTPALMNRYIAGEVESLQTVMDRHDQRLHRMANRFIRCIQMYDSAYDADDAVNSAWAAISQLIKDGHLTSVDDSVAFWKKFAVILRNEILRQNRRYRAAKRGGERIRGDWEQRRGIVAAGKGNLSFEAYSDGIYAELPPPQALVLARLELECFSESLEPILRDIFKMRLEAYTTAEIAQKLNLCPRTIERKIADIRDAFFMNRAERPEF